MPHPFSRYGMASLSMTEIIGVKFKSSGKVYSFAPGDFNPAEGSYVVVETARGPECGEVAARRHAVPDDTITAPLKPILRLATDEDMEILEKNKQYIAEAFRVCEERITARDLPMRLVDVECGFDSNKLIFYFTAESRVDFRELVKDLASAFHVRIELRQIGDRDEAKLLGGLGICGREFCCKGYLSDFQPITIKMAKEQGLALNPSKISGTCGRLMCCLRYESPVYEELLRFTPKVGSTVLLQNDPPVRAYVMEANLITGKLRVKPENAEMPITVDRDAVEQLQDLSKRMTREDLRRDNVNKTVVSKHPAAPAPAAEQKDAPTETKDMPKASEMSGENRNTASAPKENASRPQRRERPNRQNHPSAKTQKPRPQSESEGNAAAEDNSTLHPEFGETRQQAKPAPQRNAPVHHNFTLDEDFTEHRAVTQRTASDDSSAASAPEHEKSAQPGGNRRPPQQRGQRNYHHGGNHNRKFHNNPRGGNDAGGKPQNTERKPRPERPGRPQKPTE